MGGDLCSIGISPQGLLMTLIGLVACCTTEETEIVVKMPLAFLWGQFSICAQFALQMGLFGLTGVSSGFGPRGPRIRTRVCQTLIQWFIRLGSTRGVGGLGIIRSLLFIVVGHQSLNGVSRDLLLPSPITTVDHTGLLAESVEHACAVNAGQFILDMTGKSFIELLL